MKTVFLMFALSLPPQAPPLAVVQQAPPVVRSNCGCGYGSPCVCTDCPCEPLAYDVAARAAAQTGKPLVVYVGCKVRPIAGCVVCQASECFGDSKPRIIVALPANGWTDWKVDLPASTTIEEIQRIARPTVKQSLTIEQLGPLPLLSYQPRPMMMFGGFGGGRGSSC